MRLLDLFCGAGGAAAGYARAGFEVVGVDVSPQPRYPFRFVMGDALEYLAAHGREFDAVHASPPCQAYTVAVSDAQRRKVHYPDLVDVVRHALTDTGLPWVIENVVGAPLRSPLVLCGSMFGHGNGRAYLQRHRLFETSFPVPSPGPCRHAGRSVSVSGHGQQSNTRRIYGGDGFGVAELRAFMGIDWMTRAELSQAIPPTYTQWVGEFLSAHVGRKKNSATRP